MRDLDHPQRDTHALGLPLQQFDAHSVHADAIELARHGRQQSDNVKRLVRVPEGEHAILTAAPGDESFGFHVKSRAIPGTATAKTVALEDCASPSSFTWRV
jgi:hypothetical protein